MQRNLYNLLYIIYIIFAVFLFFSKIQLNMLFYVYCERITLYSLATFYSILLDVKRCVLIGDGHHEVLLVASFLVVQWSMGLCVQLDADLVLRSVAGNQKLFFPMGCDIL